MRDKVELAGMVLSSTLVGDYDKRLVILTKERGKITAFAKGARRPNSPYLGISEPFNFGTFTVLESYDAYRFLGADIKEYFSEIKNDIEAVCYATYFGDILEYLCVEGVEATDVLNLLYVSFKALGKNDIPGRLIRRVFELKVLALEGEGMAAFSCTRCNSDKVAAFDLYSNGLVCKDCMGACGARALSESAIYAIQYILSTPLNKLYTFNVKDDVMEELNDVIGAYFSRHVPKNFNSLQILSSLS